MLYQFPPPEWFETGTISYSLLIIILLVIVVGLPSSILGCWFFPPRSRRMWILAESFWIVAAFTSIPFWLPIWWPFMTRDAPEGLALFALFLMYLLPIPAALSGWEVLKKRGPEAATFRSIPDWGCSLAFVGSILFFVFNVLIIACISPMNTARRSQCKNNLKQIGLAFHNYHDIGGRFPDSQIQSKKLPPHSWRTELLPFLDQATMFRTYNQTEAWDSVNNYPLAREKVYGFICPAVREPFQQDSAGRWYTAYATLNGPNTAFPDGKGLTIEDMTDGLSNTALVTEACGQQIIWTEPRDIQMSKANLGFNFPGEQLGQSPATWSSYHRGGANTLLADGSVRFLNADTDPRILRAISTASGKELLEW